MPFEELILEYEDEEESGTPSLPETPAEVAPRPVVKAGPKTLPQAAAPVPRPIPVKVPEAKKLPEARAAIPIRKEVTQPRVMGTSALKMESTPKFESQDVEELKAQIQHIQHDADVRVAVAEFKAEFLAEMMSDMKLAEHQIGQVLIRINTKHPELKNEMLMIKKILADFTSKKRK